MLITIYTDLKPALFISKSSFSMKFFLNPKNDSMKKTLTLLVLALFGLSVVVNAQNTRKPLGRAIQEKRDKGAAMPVYSFFTQQPRPETDRRKVTRLSINAPTLTTFLRDKPETCALTLPYERENLDLELTKYEVTTEDFEVLDAKTGARYYAEKGLFYRGTLKNDPLSMVAISVFNNQILGVISDAKHGDMNLGKSVESPNATDYVLYAVKEQTNQPPPFNCTTDTKGAKLIQNVLDRAETVNMVNGCVRMSLEIDNELYVYNGSSIQNTVNYINGLMNVVYAVFTQESISMVTSQMYIWTTPDTYVCDTGIKLTSFSNSRTRYNGDLAHLITAEPGGGACGGRAWLSVLCGSQYKHGVSDILENYAQLPTYSYSVNVIAHETGHNLGSLHTHSCTWSGGPLDNCATVEDGTCAAGPAGQPHTVMSYCPSPSLHNGFGTQPGNLIRNKVQNAACLSATCTTPTCNAPTNFTLSSLPDGNSATFTWTAASGNTSFNIEYRPYNTTNSWTTIIGVSSPYTLSSLTVSTLYEVRVIGVCSSVGADFTTPIIFKTLSGTCVAPNSVTTTVLNTNCTVDWTENAAANSWEIVYGTVGFNPATGGTRITVNTKPFMLSNLALSTNYDVYIRSSCSSSGSGFTPYSSIASFTTPTSVTYCASTYTSVCYGRDPGNGCGVIPVDIKRFFLKHTSSNTTIIDNANSGCLGAVSNHTNIVGNVTAGQNYTFLMQMGTSTSGCYFYANAAIWVDYNNDGDFDDASETIFISPDFNTFTGNFTVPSNVPNGNHRLRVRRAGNAMTSSSYCTNYGDGEAEDYTISVSGSTLGAELLSLKAQTTEGGNLLTWQTANEVNMSHFDVERSSNGQNFEKIGETKAQGKAATYTFLDNTPLSTTTYYRLKINELGGKSEYSKVVSLSLKIKGLTAKAYPNPTNDVLTVQIEVEKKSDVTIGLTDILGRKIWSSKAENTEGGITLPVSMSQFANGTYFLKVSNGQTTVQQKIMKN
jgi:GEVED domain/Metallo-peptidase family M12/Secretion system C-terminal sorting domain/Fibronectin type III domain